MAPDLGKPYLEIARPPMLPITQRELAFAGATRKCVTLSSARASGASMEDSRSQPNSYKFTAIPTCVAMDEYFRRLLQSIVFENFANSPEGLVAD